MLDVWFLSAVLDFWFLSAGLDALFLSATGLCDLAAAGLFVGVCGTAETDCEARRCAGKKGLCASGDVEGVATALPAVIELAVLERERELGWALAVVNDVVASAETGLVVNCPVRGC